MSGLASAADSDLLTRVTEPKFQCFECGQILAVSSQYNTGSLCDNCHYEMMGELEDFLSEEHLKNLKIIFDNEDEATDEQIESD